MSFKAFQLADSNPLSENPRGSIGVVKEIINNHKFIFFSYPLFHIPLSCAADCSAVTTQAVALPSSFQRGTFL